MEKKNIGVGVIGCGFMGKAHSNAYNTIPYIYKGVGYEIEKIMMCSEVENEAISESKRYGFKRYCKNYKDLICDPEISLVDICASNSVHREMAILALEMGKHVLCEKPLANNGSDALAMLKAAENSGCIHMCGFNYRFIPAIKLARDLISSGRLGRIYHISISYCQESGAFADTPYEKIRYLKIPNGPGVMRDIGSHVVDLVRFLVGEVIAVSGIESTFVKERNSQNGMVHINVDDETVAILMIEGGATALLRASAVSAGRKNRIYFEVYGSEGSLIFDMEELNFLQVCLKQSLEKEVTGFTRVDVTQVDKLHPYVSNWWPKGHGLGWEHAHINEIAYLLDCLSTGKEVHPEGATFEDGYRTAAIIDSIKKSSLLRKIVEIEY